jgi:hypothetical protein
MLYSGTAPHGGGAIDLFLAALRPHAEEEVLSFVESHTLFGRSVGYIDVHLLAAARLTTGAALWTNDRRPHAVADTLGSAMRPVLRGAV